MLEKVETVDLHGVGGGGGQPVEKPKVAKVVTLSTKVEAQIISHIHEAVLVTWDNEKNNFSGQEIVSPSY